jgi:hypothetical protein
MTQLNQGKREIQIFKKFTDECPYKINLTSVKKENPPKPDIYCKLKDGTELYFELVECLDNSIAKTTSDQVSLKYLLDDEKNKLPLCKRMRFKRKYKNALIYIAFNEKLPLIRRKRSIPYLIDFLLNLNENQIEKDEIEINGCPEIKWFNIQRGDFVGPMFRVEGVTFFGVSILKKIRDKFNKEYATKNKIDLLAYYALQPEISKKHWLQETADYIKDNITNSPFNRIWIYSYTKDKILFLYPDLNKKEFEGIN